MKISKEINNRSQSKNHDIENNMEISKAKVRLLKRLIKRIKRECHRQFCANKSDWSDEMDKLFLKNNLPVLIQGEIKSLNSVIPIKLNL